jgi:transketolase
MRDRFIETLINQIHENPEIILITGDLGFGVLDKFKEQYPDNFINAGVAEQNMTGLAAGLALEGKIVFTYSIANFPTLRCLEQIRNDICYHNLNVNIVSIGAGFSYGALGMSHHATEDLAIMRALPNLTLTSPSTLWETEQVTKAVIHSTGPSYLRLDKSFGFEESEDHLSRGFKLGEARILNKGVDCTIFVTGGILEEVQKAAKMLENKRISTQVISVHTIKPFDVKIVQEVIKSSKIIVSVEEHSLIGGLGSVISEVIAEEPNFNKIFLKLGLKDQFSSIVGNQEYLRKESKIDSISIFDRIISKVK